MNNYFADIAWGTIANNVTIYKDAGIFQLNQYTINIDALDFNEPGASTLECEIGDYFIDYLGYPWEILEITDFTSYKTIRVYDINERSISELTNYGPYPQKIGYVYRSINGTTFLSQAQLLKLDSQARDRINNMEKALIGGSGGGKFGYVYEYSSNDSDADPTNGKFNLFSDKIIKYGFLYSWEAMYDSASNHGGVIAGLSVPTEEDWNTLISSLGGSSIAGGKMKTTGTDYWLTSGGTNDLNFNLKGGGRWNAEAGVYQFLKTHGMYLSITPSPPDFYIKFFVENSTNSITIANEYKTLALSVRLFRALTPTEQSTYANGETIQIYEDYNGNSYNLIRVGTKGWINENIIATNSVDGTELLHFAYNNDDDNAFSLINHRINISKTMFSDLENNHLASIAKNDLILLYQKDNTSINKTFTVSGDIIDNTTYYTIPVIIDSENGILNDTKEYSIVFKSNNEIIPIDSFKPIVFYDFNSDSTVDWTKNHCTLSIPSKSVTRYTATGLASNINRLFNFDGGQNKFIKIRYRWVSGIQSDAKILYTTSGHGYSASHYKNASLNIDGEWHILELDMSELTVGDDDWIDNIITGIRFDLTDLDDSIIDIDWIGIGKIGWGTQHFEDEINDISISSKTTSRSAIYLGDNKSSTVDGDSPGIMFGKQFSSGRIGPVIYGAQGIDSASWGKRDFVLLQHNSDDTTTLYEVFRIKANGHVGILTSSPTTPLDVNGTITATGGNSTQWNTAYSHSQITTGQVHGMWTKSGASVYYNGGDVGIGISPASRLHVSATNTEDINALFGSGEIGNSAYKGSIYFVNAGINSWYNYGADNVPLTINNSGYLNSNLAFRDLDVRNGKESSIMYCKGSVSSVGIGTNYPAGKLHVVGNIVLNDISIPPTPTAGLGTVYSHSQKLYYKNNSGSIYDLTQVGLGDAPTNGYTYGRNNGSWVVVSGGSGSTDYINSATFNTGTGLLKGTGPGLAGFSVNLDGRYTGNVGTVTSISAGNGMNFTTIGVSGSVTMGTPSTLTTSTTNSASGTTHTHAITGVQPLSSALTSLAATGGVPFFGYVEKIGTNTYTISKPTVTQVEVIPDEFTTKSGTNISWSLNINENIYISTTGTTTFTLSNISSGQTGIIYLYGVTGRVLNFSSGSYSFKMDTGTNKTSANQMTLISTGYYAITLIAVSSSVILINTARYV